MIVGVTQLAGVAQAGVEAAGQAVVGVLVGCS